MIIPSSFFFIMPFKNKATCLMCLHCCLWFLFYLLMEKNLYMCYTKMIKIISKENHFNIWLHFVFDTEEMTDDCMVYWGSFYTCFRLFNKISTLKLKIVSFISSFCWSEKKWGKSFLMFIFLHILFFVISVQYLKLNLFGMIESI